MKIILKSVLLIHNKYYTKILTNTKIVKEIANMMYRSMQIQNPNFWRYSCL